MELVTLISPSVRCPDIHSPIRNGSNCSRSHNCLHGLWYVSQVFLRWNTNNGDKHCERSHFYINLTFRMLVNIHFQKWTLTVFITSLCVLNYDVCVLNYDGPRTKVFRFFWFIQLAATHRIIWRFNFFARRSLWTRRHCVEWHYLRIFSFSTVARLSLKGYFWNVLEVFEDLK